MFWLKPLALSPLAIMNITEGDFDPEKGRKDGTLAHAFERFIGLLAIKNGFQIMEIGETTPQLSGYAYAAPMPSNMRRKIDKSPIIVYQMGEAESQTIVASLQNAYRNHHLDVPIHLVPVQEKLAVLKKKTPRRSAKPVGRPDPIAKSMQLIKAIDADPGQRWNLASLVRDPVARSVDSFFQNLDEYFPDWKERYANEKLGLDELRESFLDDPAIHHAADSWFDAQLKPLFGIDVYASDFPIEAGYKIYESSPRARLLLMRLEDLNDCAQRAMLEFLGLEDFKLYDANGSADNTCADLCQAFKAKALPREYVDRMYSTRFARHFYTESQIEGFRHKWTESTH
jgi:hypothetical protein